MIVKEIANSICGIAQLAHNTYMWPQGIKVGVNMKQNFCVYDEQEGITRYIPHQLYKITVRFPGTGRTKEFVGMDRGSAIMQAEVAREEGDSVLLVESEQAITLYQMEKI